MAQSRSKRNYRSEYKNYQGRPEQIKNRSMRNKARRMYEEAHGDLPGSMDVDHRKPIVKGGNNGAGNTRALPKRVNRSFARTRRAGMK